MERYAIIGMDGSVIAEFTPNAADKMFARKEARKVLGSGFMLGDMNLFYGYFAAKSRGLADADSYDKATDWFATINDVEPAPDGMPTDAEGEGSTMPD